MNKPTTKHILKTTQKLNRDWLLDDTEESLTITSGEITELWLHRKWFVLTMQGMVVDCHEAGQSVAKFCRCLNGELKAKGTRASYR